MLKSSGGRDDLLKGPGEEEQVSPVLPTRSESKKLANPLPPIETLLNSIKKDTQTHDEEEGSESIQIVDLDVLIEDRSCELPASKRDEGERVLCRNGKAGRAGSEDGGGGRRREEKDELD